MTTKTYDKDPLGILQKENGSDPLGILDAPVKKKDEVIPSNDGVEALPTGTESTSPSKSPSTLPFDVEGIFSFGKQRKKQTPLKANSRDVDVKSISNGVTMGNIEADELSNAYSNPLGKPVVEQLIKQYAPDLGGQGWDKDVFRNEEKWGELSKRIKTANRINAKVGRDGYLNEVDNEISRAITGYKTVKVSVSGGTGGASVSVTENPFPVIDINNPYEYAGAIDQLKRADKIVDKNGQEVVGGKERIIAALQEKAISLTADQGVDSEVNSMSEKVTQAIARSNINREIGESIPTDEFAKNDKLNEEHFKLGLSYIKKVQPGQYKNVVKVIDEGKQIPDDDFRNISSFGQKVYNEQVFFGAADNPELIDKETYLDYTTRSDKKAQYAAIIGERLKASGRTNRREFSEEEIKKAAGDLPNKSIVQELANEEKIFGYDAIPKSGAMEAFVQGLSQPIDGIKSTFELFLESPVDTYIRSKRLDTGSGQKVVDDEGQVSSVLPSDRGNIYYDALRGLGQFVPQVLLTKGIGGGAAGVIAADTRVALTPALKAGISTYGGTAISTFLQTYGDSYADYLQKTGDPSTARLAGTIDAGSAAAFELLLPDVKIADRAFAGLKGELVSDIVGLVRKGGDPALLASKGRSFVEKFAKGVVNIQGQEIAEEVGTNIVDVITEAIFSPQTSKDRDLGAEVLETVKQTAVSMAIPSLFGAAGAGVNKDFARNAFDAAAISLPDYKQTLDKALNNGAINQEDYNSSIKLLSTHSQSINNVPRQDANGNTIPNRQQLDYAYEDTKIKVYKEKASSSEGVAKEMWESKIKESEDVQRKILMPKEGEKVAEPVAVVDENERFQPQVQEVVLNEKEVQTEDTITTLRSKAGEEERFADMQYFIDKAGETPAQYIEKYGPDITNELLAQVPTKKLLKNMVDAGKFSRDNPNIPILEAEIQRREAAEESQAAITTDGTAENVVPSTLKDVAKRVEDVLDVSSEEAGVLTMLQSSKILSPTEKKILWRQYKDGVMTDKEVAKYTNVDVADLQDGNVDKWAAVILDKTKGAKVKAEDIEFEEIPQQQTSPIKGDVVPSTLKDEVVDKEFTAEGGNIIVNEDGSPRLMYHKSDTLFDSFDKNKKGKGRFGKGFYFSFNPNAYKGKYEYVVQLNVKENNKDGLVYGNLNNRTDNNFGEVLVDSPDQIKIVDILDENGVSVYNKKSSQTNETKAGAAVILPSEQRDIPTTTIAPKEQPKEQPVRKPAVILPKQGENSPAEQTPIQAEVATEEVAKPTVVSRVVPSAEPAAKKGRTPVTLTGNTEQERQALIKRRKADTFVPTVIQDEQKILDRVNRFNKEGLRYKRSSRGRSELNNIKVAIDQFNRTHNKKYSALQNRTGNIEYKNNDGSKVQRNNKATGDLSIDETGKPLMERSEKTKEVFNELLDRNIFPTGYTVDGRRMNESQLDGAIQDILDGIPSRAANNYLNALEVMIQKDDFDFSQPGIPQQERISLDNILETEKEQQGELMDEKAVEDYLNEQSNLTPEQEQTISDNIETLIDEYTIVGDTGQVQTTPEANEATGNTAAEQNTVNENEKAKAAETAENKFDAKVDKAADAIIKFLTPKVKVDAQKQGLGVEEIVRAGAAAIKAAYRIEQNIEKAIASGIDEMRRLWNDAGYEDFPEDGLKDMMGKEFADLKPAPATPKATKSENTTENEIISKVLSTNIDAKEFPAIFDNNRTEKQLTAVTQGIGQDRVVDGDYIVALQDNLREVSIQSAHLLRNELGADWGVKTLKWIEDNPNNGNLAQVIGVLNIISTENFQDIQNTHDGNRLNKLKQIQNRIDVAANFRARTASLGLNQRRLYVNFAKGDDIRSILHNSILTPEMLDLQDSFSAAVSEEVTDDEINAATIIPPPPPKKQKTSLIRKVTGTAKRQSNPSLKDDLKTKASDVANKTKKSFKELIDEANAKIKNIKC